MVVGDRGIKSSGAYRKLGKMLIRRFAKILMEIPIEDLNSGYDSLYRTDLAKRYISLCPDNMPYSDIITLVFISQRHLVLEQPISILKQGERQEHHQYLYSH